MSRKPNKRSGKMAKKGGQVVLQEEINTNEDWSKMLERTGVYVVDVYTEWCGPCVPMVANLKKIKLELGNENLHYAIAKSDNISALERFRQKSEPHWMFFFDGKMANLIIGANAPRLMKLIADEMNQYEKFKRNEVHRDFLPMNRMTDEERKKLIEKDNYEKQKMKKEKQIRDERMTKVWEHALKKFTPNVQMQTCIVFFPHTIKYIMVEKPPEEDGGGGGGGEEEPSNKPVMVEKRVCEVANACALKYEELMVIEAKEIQLTEDTLRQMFLADEESLESLPRTLVDQVLSKKVYSVMLSLPRATQDDAANETAGNDDDGPAEPEDFMGVVERKTTAIVYGEGGTVMNPMPKSLAADYMVVNEFGEKTPSLYTPMTPLSKCAALTILFQKFCANNGFVTPQPPSPQYLVIFEINKSNIVLPIIEDLEEKIVHYGFFRSADPENPRLLCKDPELLTAYGMDKIGKDAKLVLSVLRDDKDKSLLRFVDVGPIYVSPHPGAGIDDAIKFFPHDFDEMDGEVKTWLAEQSARDEDGDQSLGEEVDEQMGVSGESEGESPAEEDGGERPITDEQQQ